MKPSAKDECRHPWVWRQMDGREVCEKYDEWAERYDDTLAAWDYRSPMTIATLVRQHLSLTGGVLDAGCGTGLSGKALAACGIAPVTGIDISLKSLSQARQTGAYAHLIQVDMCRPPFPFRRNEFSGLTCVGVLAYLHNTDALMREFCRVVRPGGVISFTQREDAFTDREYPRVIAALEASGLWKTVLVSEPEPYLPKNEEFANRIKVINAVFRVGIHG